MVKTGSPNNFSLVPSIDPSKTLIIGTVYGNLFFGTIEMTFKASEIISDYILYIGKRIESTVVFHDFNLIVDDKPYSITLTQKSEAEEAYKEAASAGEQAFFGEGSDTYVQFTLSKICKDQIITISAHFESLIKMISNNEFSLSFPLSCPTKTIDKYLQCPDFRFQCNFLDLSKKINIKSNIPGNYDESKSEFHISTSIMDTAKLSLTFSFIESLKGCFIGNGHYATLTLFPSQMKSNESNESNIKFSIPDCLGEEFIFIIDCSGSMEGKEIELASQCLLFFLKSLPVGCYFNIVRFGSTFQPLFKNSVQYSDETVNSIIDSILNMKPDLGGTVLSEPLSYVFSTPSRKFRNVFVLTDGCVFDPQEV